MKDLISIIDVKDHVGETVKIGAWVADKSGKGKNFERESSLTTPVT